MIYKLEFPELSPSTYLGYNIGIRPCRKTGPRMEKEKIKNKIIYHNYGHSGYGVAMSFGSAKLVTDMFVNELGHKHLNVTIIGSGYVGLMTAKYLVDLGYKVTVYSKTKPSEWGLFNDSEHKLTSQIAAGKIETGIFPWLENIPKAKIIYQQSIQFLTNLYNSKTSKGIFKRDYYVVNNPDKEVKTWIECGFGPIERCKVTFGNGQLYDSVKTSVFQVDGDIFLNELMTELISKQVKFVTREFKTIDEITDLSDAVIFNCLGYQSKYLFKDDLVFPVKGIMLAFKPIRKHDYFLSLDFHKEVKMFELYPMNNRVSVGMTHIYEEQISEDQDLKHRKSLLNVIEEFKKEYLQFKPKL